MLWIRISISAIIAWLLWSHIDVYSVDALHNAATAFAGVTATMLGFMIAALSILAAVANQKLLRNMQKTGHYKKLLHELYHASAAYAAGMIASLTSIFLTSPYLSWGITVTIFAVAYSTAMIISVGHKFWVVLTNLHST
ncbi:hypothetical protein [Methylotenera sp. G11]|uniref:hypothetical protein n=1 Tax=Methylotenera sp. G11 TaxID=1506585 RepID=UPI00064821C2|nr:hypothetical protein [Methylotenera sp. G11]